MKLSVSSLKNLDYKQLGINHGEKFAIVLVGLLLAFVLVSTKWTQTIQDSPTALIEQAKSAESKIKQQAWPENESKAMQTGSDLGGKVASLLAPVELAPWVLTIPMNKLYHPDRNLISKPTWFGVKDLIADAQVVDLRMSPQQVQPLIEGFKKIKEKDPSKSEKAKKPEPKKEAEEKPAETFDDIKRRGDLMGAGNATDLNASGFGRMMNDNRKKAGKERSDVRNIAGASARKGKKGKKSQLEDQQTVVQTTVVNKKPKAVSRGYHVVSVRGIFPLREQVTEMVRVIGNSATRREAQDLIQMHDFKLERQTAQPGPNPWSGPWEAVDRESVADMLRSDIFDFDPEPVLEGIVDYHICMPLPYRMIGDWGRLATHPAVQKFELSPEEMESQVEYERKLIAKLRDEDLKSKSKEDNGGFADFTRNTRKMMRRATNSPVEQETKTVQQQIVEELQKKPGQQPSEQEINARLVDFITKRATPQDHLLLFRYLDFTVEPGKIYRYRVKLTVENPFKERHPEEVTDPSIIEGEFRDTEYSAPTKPIYVPLDARTYVTRVDSRAGRPTLPGADFDVYQWFASTGTVVNRILKMQVGQMVGGQHQALVVRPAEETADTERVPFNTNDALIDVKTGFSLDPSLHREIFAEVAAEDRKATGPMVPDEAVLVDANGTLRLFDGLDQQKDHQQTKQRFKAQMDQWEALIKSDADKGNERNILDSNSGTKKPRKAESKRAAKGSKKS